MSYSAFFVFADGPNREKWGNLSSQPGDSPERREESESQDSGGITHQILQIARE